MAGILIGRMLPAPPIVGGVFGRRSTPASSLVVTVAVWLLVGVLSRRLDNWARRWTRATACKPHPPAMAVLPVGKSDGEVRMLLPCLLFTLANARKSRSPAVP